VDDEDDSSRNSVFWGLGTVSHVVDGNSLSPVCPWNHMHMYMKCCYRLIFDSGCD
jgi:hypothetical protein